MIKKLRGILVITGFIIFAAGTFVMGFIIFPLIKFFKSKKNKKDELNKYSEFVQASWNFFVKFLIFIRILDLNIEDIEKLKSIKNSVIVSTHPSYIDGVILISIIPKTTCIVAERLSTFFLTKNIIKSIFIISGKPVEEIAEDSVKMIDNDFNILVFPSGIRHRKNEFPKIRKGASLIAIRSKKDIVPIKMSTDIDFLQINQPVYEAGSKPVQYEIKLGNIIKTKDFTDKYKDEIILKREITKEITKELYER